MNKVKVFITLLTICLIFIITFSLITATAGTDVPLRTLSEQLISMGREFYIGCAVPSSLSSADSTIVKREFNIVTCENDMKIGTISPSSSTQYNYSGGDSLVNLAKANNMVVHGHTFVWHKYLPSWVNGTKSMMETYISNVGNHFKGNIYVWDVVNEAFHRDGTYRINAISSSGQDGASIFGQKQTKQYIEDAFKAARTTDPYAKLIYNDYAIETNDAKFNGMYAMLKDFKSRSIPIDGVGFQMHIDSTFSETDVQNFSNKMKQLADLGLEIYITELDGGAPDATQAGLDKQAQIYGWIMKACLDQPMCKAVQLWGIRDSQSWRINPEDPADKAIAPLIFDDNGNKKPSYYAIQNALQEALNKLTSSGTTSSRTTLATTTTTTTTPTNIGSNVLNVELESLSNQALFSPLAIVNNSSASGGKAIQWPDNSNQSLGTPSDSATGQISITFTLSQSANVKFEIQANMSNANNDSFYYKLDSGSWNTQNNSTTSGFGVLSPATFNNLSSGSHTLRILRREDGTLLDKVILTSSSGTISYNTGSVTSTPTISTTTTVAPSVTPSTSTSSGSNILNVELESLSSQALFSPLAIVNNSTASGGKAIQWPDNSNQNLGTPSDSATGQISITFTLSQSANVKFEIQANMSNANNDSFYYKLDSGSWNTQNNTTTSGFAILSPATFNNLSSGSHTLRILRREDGTLLDKVILTSSSGTIK